MILYKKTRMTTTIKDSGGTVLNTQLRTVEFDDDGLLVLVTDTFGNVTTYVHDSNARILEEGHYDIVTGVTTKTAYSYDSIGNVLTKTEALGTAVEKTTTYTYDPMYSLVTTETVSSVVNSSLVSVVTNSYDLANGTLLSREESGYMGNGTPYTYTTSYTYHPNGKLWTVDGPGHGTDDAITYTYTTKGYLESVAQPLIGTTTYSGHDDLGNPGTVSGPNGITVYTYWPDGKVKTVTAPGDTSPTQYFYVSGGCGASCGGTKIDHITLPEGNTITYHYDDGLGNLTSISDILGNSINYTYDSEGNRLTEQIKDPGEVLQKSLSYSYDALNRLELITNPDNSYTKYSYYGQGNRRRAKNPNDAENVYTEYEYDALNRLKKVTQPGTIETPNVVTNYDYDTNNNLIYVKDASSHETTYEYDDKGRVYRVLSPDTGTTRYDYSDPSGAGNLVGKTDAKGITISYAYDTLNRLTGMTSPAAEGQGAFSITYGYDTCLYGKGRLCSMTDASGTTSYEYTPKGQVKKETKTIDSIQYVTQYTYDQNGNLKTMTYPSGRVIAYTISNDKVTAVLNNAANLATNINYKPFGGMSSLTYGNGLTGSISYDNQYRITGITAGTVMNLSYPTYDANGNIMAINNTLDPTKNKSFTYDALDRLSSATASGIWGSLGWTYDGVGNRQTEGSAVYSYAPGTNKLTGAGGLSFGYDNNGNTTSQAARSYTYNQNQRLIQVVDGAMTAGYTYNGNGQRVKKIVNGVTTIFHYNRIGLLIAESDGTGATTAEYVYLNNAPLAKIEGSSVYFYHTDHLSTPQKMTDSTGAVVWSADYKPFGEATVSVSTITNNLRFPGQFFDAETGLNYNYRRDYNPMIGRYIEADPIGQKGGLNLFAYAEDSPINWVDPLGLSCVKIWTTVTGSEFHIWDTIWRLEGTSVISADLHMGVCQYSKIQEGWLKEYLTTTYLCCECFKCQVKTEKTTRQGQHEEIVGTQNVSMFFLPMGQHHAYIGMCYPPE
jgi:RHS repeat-associated protein